METIAVFIDADNISHKDIALILQEIKSKGRIISCLVYGDWSEPSMRYWKWRSQENGLTTIQCERIAGKNSSDIKLMVDMMKYLYTRPHITMFYIVTSDADFRHVIPEIRGMNKKVNCIGSESANTSLKASCDLFTSVELLRRLEIDDDEETVAGEETVETGAGEETVATGAGEETVEFPIKSKAKLPIKSSPKKRLLGKKMRKKIWKEIEILSNDKSNIELGFLNARILSKYQFDIREYGYRRLLPFMRDNFFRYLNITKMLMMIP